MELAAKLVPCFSKKVTFPVIVWDVIRGTTTPPISSWYAPAPVPVGVCHVYSGVPVHRYKLRRLPAPQRYVGSPEQAMLHAVSEACFVEPPFVRSVGSPQSDTFRQYSRRRSQNPRINIQHSSPYSMPAIGYPNAEHRLRQFLALLLFVLMIWYGKTLVNPSLLSERQ